MGSWPMLPSASRPKCSDAQPATANIQTFKARREEIGHHSVSSQDLLPSSLVSRRLRCNQARCPGPGPNRIPTACS